MPKVRGRGGDSVRVCSYYIVVCCISCLMDSKINRSIMPRTIPDRWLAYKPHGTVVEGTNILAFKVPLKETIARNLPSEQRFTPAGLMQKFPKLKYIVDLTNTARYYYPKDFRNAGINYIKIMIPGKEVPPLEGVKKFFKAMDLFNSTAKNGELIGVHCTHGINRTGYLICRYLVQQLGWEPQQSVKAFEKARGYPIERAAYVTELMKVPRTKCDISSVSLQPGGKINKFHSRKHPMMSGPMRGPSQFDHRGRGFTNGRPPFPPPPHQPFGFGGPPPPRAFGPRPPIPPPPHPPPGRMYGPRPHAYGMPPMRPPMPPPFPGVRFPPMMPGPPGMPGPPRLPPPKMGPGSRLPGPGMPPPRLPPPGMAPPRLPPPGMAPPRMPPPRLANTRKSMDHSRREVTSRVPFKPAKRPNLTGARLAAGNDTPAAKISKDLDFTVDTFDENLTTTVCP